MADPLASFTAQVEQLKEGESASRAIRLPFENFDAKKAKKTLSNLRNSANQIATRVKDKNGFTYRVETGQFITYDGEAIALVCVVTCMEDEGEDDI